MKDLKSLIVVLLNDVLLNDVQREKILIGWKETLIDRNANCLMDKDRMELHFSYLELLDKTIDGLN